MKILNIFLFILLANTTYRCADEENLIDCNSAAKQMMGRWEGASQYTQPSSARGVTQKFAIDVTSVDDCMFYGISSFEDSFTTFSITGTIDKYGWVEFRETEYANNDGEYTNCHRSDINLEINLKMQGSEVRFLFSMDHLKCKVDGAVL